ncbi:MAG: type II toxin-antitoxin system VapC family toxin [Thermoanaerobaculia bacterium]
MILVDTSGLIAALFPDQQDHAACARVLLESEGPFVLSPFVLAEIDYLITKFAGTKVEVELLKEVASGAYMLADFHPADIDEAVSVIRRYDDLDIGLADASLVVLSRRHDTRKVLTLDERHFRTLRAAHGKPFRIFPADDYAD